MTIVSYFRGDFDILSKIFFKIATDYKEQHMKILFSPSEAKYPGGVDTPIMKENYIFPELFEKRMEILTAYNEYVLKASEEELMKLFGTKKPNVIAYYKSDLFGRATMKVIERYDGVAYDYLAYQTLDDTAKEYIDKNVIIFSNLFGPLYAGDAGLPDYKLKQGEKIHALAPEKFYQTHFSQALGEILSEEPYLDLRAGFYHKFYKPSTPYTTLKFIKDGKVVSHWAKAYRGIVLQMLAKNSIQNMDELIQMDIENVSMIEMITKGIHTEIIYGIEN